MSRPARPFQITLLASAVLASGPALGAPGDVSWELTRPSNTGIPGDYTQVIFIDDDDSPWVGGYVTFWEEGGMAHFDGTNWRVLGNVDCDQITSPRFNDVVKTDDGIMWIGSDNGLLRFDPTQEPWCVTRYHSGNTPLKGNQIAGIDVAPDGTLWIASQEFGGSSAGGLGRFDYVNNTWEFWDTTNGLPWWAGWDWVDYVATQADAGGGYTVWFGSREMGLTTYKDGLFVWYGSATPPDVDPLPISIGGNNAVDDAGNLLLSTDAGLALRAPDGTYTIIGSLPPDGTAFSVVDLLPSGRMMAGTFGANVYLWEDGTWSSLGNWGSGNHTYAFAEETNGAVWAGGIGGSARYESGAWQRYRLTNTGSLDFFAEDIAFAPNGDVAMTANAGPGVGGFDIMHPDRTWTNANIATYGLGLPWPYPTDNTSAVGYRQNGNLLFAPTNNGLKEYDGDGYIEKIPNGWSIEHIGVAGNGRAWASTDRYTVFMEDNDGVMIQFIGPDGVPAGGIAGIEPDPLDPTKVYIGAQFGIAHTDGDTWDMIPRETFGLTLDTHGHHITDFDIAPDGVIWVCSGLGVRSYDPATGELSVYDLSNAPLPSDDVHDVEVAPDGSVWISMFDHVFPYPGGVAQLKNGQWRVWQQGSSPLPHNQVWDLEARSVPGGYEIWIACASEALAVITVEGDGDAGCNPADIAEPFGVLDLADVQTFITAFATQDQLADLDSNGVFDLDDLQDFVLSFTAGCP